MGRLPRGNLPIAFASIENNVRLLGCHSAAVHEKLEVNYEGQEYRREDY